MFESRVSLEIDLNKVRNNFLKIREAVSPCSVTAILKANAYGLGTAGVASALFRVGACSFGVAEINEALELKQLGARVRILGNLLPNEIAPAVANNVICPINDYQTAAMISREAVARQRTAECQFLIDTGMGRLGLPVAVALNEISRIIKLPNLSFSGIYSHFPVAYQGEDNYTSLQMQKFKELLQRLAARNIKFKEIHMANSDAVNNFPESCGSPFNGVRIGLNLYGFFDNDVRRSLDLEPVLELKTRLAAVRRLPAGSCIGYGRTHRLLKDTLVGTVAAGYADGLPLALSNRGYLLIGGQLCPILGRVSMDYTTVSIDNVPNARCGDEVVCIGQQNDNAIPLEHWSQLKGTHAYDLLCSIGSRVKRVYLNL